MLSDQQPVGGGEFEHSPDSKLSDVAHCDDCGVADSSRQLLIVVADLGRGAFLAVLCDPCWHRRQYRAELERRRLGRGKGTHI